MCALTGEQVKEGFASATAFRGSAGFGANSIVHTTHLLDLCSDLPVVVEVVDTEEEIERLIPTWTRCSRRAGDNGEGEGAAVSGR
jgi:PII-like signaling protein